MRIETCTDVRDHLRAHLSSAALGAAMELGLFWRLADGPLSADLIARDLRIPPRRCGYWLETLTRLGLLDEQGGRYAVSAVGRAAVIDKWSQETWSLLARFERGYFPVGANLTAHIQDPASAWTLQGLAHPNYVQTMREDQEFARRFTRMLYEMHQSLATELVAVMDLSGVRRLADIGGGSGVVSLALLRRYPDLHATVLDVGNVCAAGREIAAENALYERIDYLPVEDVARDELPTGFDAALVCDTGFHDEASLVRFAQCLTTGGRLFIAGSVVAEEIAPTLGSALGELRQALHEPDCARLTQAQVLQNVRRAGLSVEFSKVLVKEQLVFVQARK